MQHSGHTMGWTKGKLRFRFSQTFLYSTQTNSEANSPLLGALSTSIQLRGSQKRTTRLHVVESSWNMLAHGDAREGKWRGKWLMEWVASTLHTTSEHGVSSITTITTADVNTSATSSRLNWRPRRFKWTRPFRRKTKSGFCTCTITFQTQSTEVNKAWSFASTPPYLLVTWRLSKHRVT